MTYAKGTSVPVAQSRMEIERTLSRYGADAFSYGYDGERAIIAFRAHNRHVKLELRVPPLDEFRWKGRLYRQNARMSLEAQREQKERELWRALLLTVKAKLEAVESGIESFEQAFLPYIMLPDGSTAGEWMVPQVDEAYRTGEMPSLLPGARRELPA